MPDGKTHLKLWRVFYPLAVCVSLVLGVYIFYFSGFYSLGIGVAISILFGYFLGEFIDPDWDEMSATNSEGRLVKIPVIGVLVYGISSIYGAIFRRHHRSFLTHFPFVSTLIRLLFVFWWFIPLYYFNIIPYSEIQGYAWLGIWTGLSIADTIHYCADLLYSNKKHRKTLTKNFYCVRIGFAIKNNFDKNRRYQ